MEDNSKQYLNYGLNYFPTYNNKNEEIEKNEEN